MIINQLASAIVNDIQSGLRGLTPNLNISIEQIEDDIIDERLIIIKEFNQKGLLVEKDLILSINCLETDCKDLNKCNCGRGGKTKPTLHVEIPQIILEPGMSSIIHFGPTDKNTSWQVYTSNAAFVHHHSRFQGLKPYIYIDTTPNENGLYDCFIFNAPMLKYISIQAIFKDPRQLLSFNCCNENEIMNINAISNEIKRRVVEKKVRWYRQFAAPITPNDQNPK